MTNTEWLRLRISNQCGLVECKAGDATIAELYRTEWSESFEQLMRNRLVMGAMRYGRMHVQEEGYYDYPEFALNKIRHYIRTGNIECLVDAANCCMLEAVKGKHPLKHFESGDDTEHVKSL